jgi:DNA-binding CsgD family transcriptional regulator
LKHWNIAASADTVSVEAADACRLIDAVGSSDRSALAAAVLALIERRTPVSECTVIACEAERRPRLISAAGRSEPRLMFHCASHYAHELFRRDRIQLHLGGILATLAVGGIVAHRQTLAQVIDPELKRLYGQSLGIGDAMAISVKTGRREWITAGIGRRKELGCFDDEAVKAILQLAPLIGTGISRHCRLESGGESVFRASVSDGIDELCPRLTARERQVILGILDGGTAEHIAAELGLRPTTVITYRSRAYEKLGVSSRRELFSVILRSHGADRSAALAARV